MAGYWKPLQIYEGSGLTFPWAEYVSRSGGVSDVSMGADGVNQGMAILIYWSDLPEAVQQLLGYSVRAVSDPYAITGATTASPIQITSSAPHPFVTGDTVTVSGVLGLTGANGAWVVTSTGANTFTLNDSVGTGAYTANSGQYTYSSMGRYLPWRHPYWTQLWCTRISSVKGMQVTGNIVTWTMPAQLQTGNVIGSPVTEYTLALLTLQFTRPNYVILANKDISRESDRYLDKFWRPNVQMLSREGQTFVYSEGSASPGGPLNKQFPGSVGQKLMHLKLQRTWHEIPEMGVYDANGMPSVLARFMGRVNSMEFLGMAAGTVLCESLDITPTPLQMPAELMQIAARTTQNQVNVTFHLDYFDPPLGTGATTRGHNCMPWSGNTKWYKVTSQVGGFTPFETADFNSMFKII